MDVEVKMVKVGDLIPNDWNPNRMTDKVLKAEKESIEKFGFIDPITARAHPKRKGKLEIVDGEHRWRVAKLLDFKEVPVVELELDDIAARKLTIILNETRGSADVVELSELLSHLDEQIGDLEELVKGMPFSTGEVEELLEMAGLEMPDYGGGSLDPADPSSGPRTIQFIVDEATGKLWEKAQRQSEKLHGKPETTGEAAAGVIFGRIVKGWMEAQK